MNQPTSSADTATPVQSALARAAQMLQACRSFMQDHAHIPLETSAQQRRRREQSLARLLEEKVNPPKRQPAVPGRKAETSSATRVASQVRRRRSMI